MIRALESLPVSLCLSLVLAGLVLVVGMADAYASAPHVVLGPGLTGSITCPGTPFASVTDSQSHDDHTLIVRCAILVDDPERPGQTVPNSPPPPSHATDCRRQDRHGRCR